MNILFDFTNGSKLSESWLPMAAPEDRTVSKITLMPHEKDMIAVLPAITAITTFRTNGCSPGGFLNQKISEMLQKNPWLMGRLVSDAKEGMCLKYKKSDPEETEKLVTKYFQVIEDFDLPENCSYASLVQKFEHLQVKKGTDSVDKDEPLFRVTLVKVKGRDEIVLIFSMCHVIVDGFAFYRLQSMLDRNARVEALSAVRCAEYDAHLANLLGKPTVDWLNSPFLKVGLITCAVFGSAMKTFVVKVDNAWVAAQKAAFSAKKRPDLDFISTNDILTAWHNQVCNSDIALMFINCRNRVPTFTEQMAGNYESSLMYNGRGECDTPEAIRRSLQTFRNASDSSPSALKTMWWNGSMVTNWSSFCKQLDISDASLNCTCEHLLHLPVVDGRDCSVCREALCIFKMDAEHTGLLVLTRFLTPDMLEATGVGKVCKTF